jgi:hypothetical protein
MDDFLNWGVKEEDMALSKEQEKWSDKIWANEKNAKKVPEELSSEEFWLEAVCRNGVALQYVPDAQKTEPICLAAVKYRGWLLQYVPDAQKTEAVYLRFKRPCRCAARWQDPAIRSQSEEDRSRLPSVQKALPQCNKTVGSLNPSPTR